MTLTVPTATEIIDQAIVEVRGLGMKLTLATQTNGALTATTVDHRLMAGGTAVNVVANRYRGGTLWVPSAAAADQIRRVSSIAVSATTCTITCDGPVFSAGLSAVTAYLLALPPADLIHILNDCLSHEYFETTIPLTEVPDGDFQASAVDSGSTSSGQNTTKVTTVANVWPGLKRSQRGANTGAAGYNRTATIRIWRGKQHYAWAILRADVGTAILRIVDASGNSIASVSTTEEEWAFVYTNFTPGPTIEEISFQYEGTEATADAYWAAAGLIRPGNYRIPCPTDLTRHNRLKSISAATFALGGDETGVQAAYSRELDRLREGVDYRFVDEQYGAATSHLEILSAGRSKGLDSVPLFITYMRPFGSIDAFTISDLSLTTNCDLDRMVAQFKHRLGKSYPQWKEYRNDGLEEGQEIADASATQEPEAIIFHSAGSLL